MQMQAPRDFILDVARKAAENTQSSLSDIFHRPKSQAYLLGQAQKAFPDRGGAELKQLITALRWELSSDPTARVVDEKPTRPPSRGREPVHDPKWDERLRRLRSLIDVPMTTAELLAKASRELGWDKSFFQAAIAASESRTLLEYHPPHWMPAPKEDRNVPKNSRIRVRPCIREIECLIGKDDEQALVERQKQVNSRRGILIAKLDDQEREIRARHRRELADLLGPLRAEKLKLEKELQAIIDQLSAGTTTREVACQERFDYETGLVSTVRLDTKDVIERRPMAGDERQLELEGS